MRLTLHNSEVKMINPLVQRSSDVATALGFGHSGMKFYAFHSQSLLLIPF